MINVNMSSNLTSPSQDWGELASMVKAGDINPACDASVNISGNRIVVTVDDGKNTRSVRISIPDLGSVDEVPDKEALQSIADKIVNVAKSLSSNGSVNPCGWASHDLQESIQRLQANLVTATGSSGPGNLAYRTSWDPSLNSMNTSKALFDLFALMALMVEIAQKQRDTSREIRLVENQQIQNSIKQQADEMRSAAAISLAFGIVSSVISGVMSAVSIGMQAKACAQQTTATKQRDMPTQNLRTAQRATDPPAAKANLKAVQDQVGPQIREQVETADFTAAKQDFVEQIGPVGDQLKAAEAKQTQIGKELTALKEHPDAKPEAIEAKTKEYEQASKAVSDAKAAYSEKEHAFFDKLDSQVKANDAEIKTTQDEIASKTAELKKAHGQEAADLKSEISSLEGKLDTLTKKGQYLRAVTADMKAQYASDGMKNADLARAQNKYDFAKYEMQMSNQFAGSQQMMNRWMGIQQLSMSLSQMTNAAGNMIGEMVRANSTMEGVEQTQHNEQLDQIKDLFSQAETVVQAVIQLMQAVLSAENESLMEAIRA